MALVKPTGRIRYVDPNSSSGGDGTTNALTGDNRAYVSLNAAIAAEKTALSSSTAGTTDGILFLCRGNGSAVDSTTVTSANMTWTTSEAKPIWIEGDGNYHLNVSDAFGLYVYSQYVHVERVNVKVTSSSASARSAFYVGGIAAGGSLVEFEACVAHGDVGSNTSTGECNGFNIADADVTVQVRNCWSIGWLHNSTHGMGFFFNCSAATVQNNTAYACRNGFYRSAGTITSVNNGASECNTGFYGTGFPGTTGSTTTPTFADAANFDLRLASTDTTWKDQGTEQAYDTDIDGALTGTTRNDIGAHEYESGGEEPPAATVSMLCLLGVG